MGAQPHNQVSYCRRWNFRRHQPIDPFTAAQAKARDAAAQVYSVIVPGGPDGSAPEAVIEIDWHNDFAGVWFFDAHGRRSLNYAFRRKDGQLFLFDMIQYSYPDDQPHTLSGATRTEEFTFKQNGDVQLVITDDGAQQKTTEHRRGVDVRSHWEPLPSFGDWASLARYNRDAPIS